MSNAKVLNYSATTTSSASIRQPTSLRSGGNSNNNNNMYSLRHGTFTSATIQTHPQQQHNMLKCTKTVIHAAESHTMASQNRVREIKRQLTASNNLSPLSSPQLIRSTRAKPTESSGWTSSTTKVKSSCSSGSNSVESIVPKYQIATNTSSSTSSSALSQKRSYLNQTSSTINKLSNKSMCLRNAATSDKSKKDSRSNNIDTLLSAKKTVSTATGKKFLVKPLYASSTSSISPTKSFSSKFPNGLPFESEFYHFRKNNARRSSVASDSTRSNNSSDEFNNNARLSSSPYQDEFRRNPSNDALYVDFTLKHFNNPFDSSEDDDNGKKLQLLQKHHHEISSASSSVKTKYLLSDKNYFCEFESVKSSAKTITSGSSVSSSQLIDDRTITGLAEIKSSSTQTKNVIFISKANFFPKCNQQELDNGNDDIATNEWVEDNVKTFKYLYFREHSFCINSSTSADNVWAIGEA